MKRLALLLLVAGCGMDLDAGGNPNDAGTSCTLTLSFDPPQPVASSIAPIRAEATLIGAPGVPTYTWSVEHNGAVAYTFEAADQSQIGFIAPVAGTYQVTVDVSGVDSACSHQQVGLNVGDPNGVNDVFRLRTVAGASLAPPQETVIQLRGNASEFQRDIALDPGLVVSGTVKSGTTPVPAYIKLVPVGAPNAFTETYSASDGTYAARLLGQMHSVLIIPTSTTLAPRLVAWMPGVSDFTVSAGTLVTGNVRLPGNVFVAGAKVQLVASDGTPSTIGTTDASGNFSLRADFATAAMTVKVTPLPTSGLPRLEATGSFNLGQPLQIDYAASTPCDLAGNAVKRSGTNQAGAKVTFVGSLPGVAGTIGGVSATGTVHITATANGSGVLPATLVPRAALSAVVELAADDYAVDAVDTTTCAAQTVDALAPITRSGTAQNDAATPLGGVRIEATPIGVLAQAEVQPIIATANSAGAFSIALAAGGQYDVRFVDPQARAAPFALMSVAPAGVPSAVTLPKAMTIFGNVSVTGVANPVVGASVQLLCAACTGLEASRPVAATATDAASNYRVAVPDPGTN
jgi:hypothetical protein